MFTRMVLATALVGALALGAALPDTASANWRHRCHGHYRPYLAGPPIVVGGYYPATYYYGAPYRRSYYGGPFYRRAYYGSPYGWPYYGSGVSVSFGW